MLGGLLCGSPFNNTPSVGAITWEKPTIIYVDLSILQITAAAIDGSATALSLLYLLTVTWMLSDLSAWARGLLASTLALWVTFNILPLMATLLRYYLGGTHYHD